MRFLSESFLAKNRSIFELKILKEKNEENLVDLSKRNLEPLKMLNFLLKDFQGNLVSVNENSFSDWLLRDKIRIQAGF